MNLGVTLAIGDTEPVTIGLDNRLPAGPWDAEITLRSGLIERSARATITFPNAGAAAPAFPATHHRRWPVFMALSVVTGFAIIAAVGLWLGPFQRRGTHVAKFTHADPKRNRSTPKPSNATRNRSRSVAISVPPDVGSTDRSLGVVRPGRPS